MAKDRTARDVAATNEVNTPQSAKKSHKRKRELDGSAVDSATPAATEKPKKHRKSATSPEPEKKKKRHSKKREQGDQTAVDAGVQEEKAGKESSVAQKSLQEGSADAGHGADKTKKQSKGTKRRASKSRDDGDEGSGDIEEEEDDDDDEAEDEDQEGASKGQKGKFSGVLSKFERSAKVKREAKVDDEHTKESEAVTAEPVEAHGLEPLPQPEDLPEDEEKPAYSSLPQWLAHPITASEKDRTSFSELGIKPDLLRILQGRGYEEAFAVQSTVIPLLLPGPKEHSGDVCISAATGSGKTLSYVLPLVTALEPISAPRLRGLIVVPTRELVKQAREACELCTAGSGLQIGSAVGNVAIKDEQQLLMRVDQVYGPETFKSRQQMKFTGDDWANFNLQDYISEAADLNESLPGYLHRPEPDVDILICTPGRLVDHLRYTKGFTLKHLQWLVIDEADRLLNESFQEWVNVVMGSLDARKVPETFGSSGRLLSELGFPVENKDPKKVVLSATMTRDVSKLNSLRLANPRLVVIGSTGATDADKEGVSHGEEQFTLPATLKEYSISVGDGSQKPLYLLRLLLSNIGLGANRSKPAATTKKSSDSEETSSDDTSSDETSSDGSSSEEDSDETSSDECDSDSDSDTSSSRSDSDSDSESEAESEAESESESDNAKAKDAPKPDPSRTTVLIFTKSSESASRLSRLLGLLDPSLANSVGTIIKSNKSSASRKTLAAFRRGKISVIVATDRASRGLDLPSLTHVVNYDIPTSITTYVHRVGRTARADNDGSAWTLFAHREGRWFSNEIARGSDGKITRSTKVERVNMKLDDMTDAKKRYASALDVLEHEVRTDGKVKSSKPKA